MNANPPVPGGGWPLPSRSQQMVDETGFPQRQGQQGLLSHLLLLQLALHVSLTACPYHEGPCWPCRALGTHQLCCPAGMCKVSRAGRWPTLAAWAASSKTSRARGRRPEAEKGETYLRKWAEGSFKMQIQFPRVAPRNLNFY